MNSGTTANVKANNGGKQKFHFEWLWPLIIRPRKTTAEIVKQDKSVWLTPLLVISILAILAGLIASPIRKNAIISGANLPENFQYYSSDQQAEFMNAQATQSSALFTLVFPVISSLLGIWVTWFLLSSIFHLVLTLSGSRASNIHSYNLIGWSMLPIGIRYLVQIAAMIFTHTLIQSAGLSGFIDASAKGGWLFCTACWVRWMSIFSGRSC
jgi:ABC-type spermidine/putrescine transport system permease subunit I